MLPDVPLSEAHLEKPVHVKRLATHHPAQVSERVLWQDLLAERAYGWKIVCVEEGEERREVHAG